MNNAYGVVVNTYSALPVSSLHIFEYQYFVLTENVKEIRLSCMDQLITFHDFRVSSYLKFQIYYNYNYHVLHMFCTKLSLVNFKVYIH